MEIFGHVVVLSRMPETTYNRYSKNINLNIKNIPNNYSTGQFIMDLKKSEKLKYFKNWTTHWKFFSMFVRKANKEENAKIAAPNFEICGRRWGFKNTRKSPFSTNKNFSMHFSKKLLWENSVYIHVLHHFSKSGEHLFINKKIKKKISRRWLSPFNHSNMLLLTL